MEIEVGEQSEIAHSWLVSLVASAVAPRSYPELGLRDVMAEQLISLLGVEPEYFDPHELRCAAIKSQLFDEVARNFLMRNPEGWGVGVGAGFSTRFFRLDDGRVRWVDVDPPEFSSIKRKLIPESSRYLHLSRHFLDPAWLDALVGTRARPVLLICDDVLLRFPRRALELFFDNAARALTPRSEIAFLFDAQSGVIARSTEGEGPLSLRANRHSNTLYYPGLRWGSVRCYSPALRHLVNEFEVDGRHAIRGGAQFALLEVA